jgi:uncharacterized repeat protein (TIGR03803 family)
VRAALIGVLLTSVAMQASAAKFDKVLHELNGQSDGYLPDGGLTEDSAGNFYGTAEEGGAYGGGTVFKLSKANGGGWTFNTIYSLTGGADASEPQGTVTFDSAGNLYGTSIIGASQASAYGAVFQLVPDGKGNWNLGKTFDFDGTNGIYPETGVIVDAAGNLYGTTQEGGPGNAGYGYGTVFELTPSGNTFSLQTLVAFTGDVNGSFPAGGLIMDSKGDLFGTAPEGGTYNYGIVFKLHHGTKGWKETILHSFNYPTEGAAPMGNLLLDRAGNLYGTTNNFAGTIFKLTRPTDGATAWTLTTLYQYPFAQGGVGLVFDKSGNLYGAGSGSTTKCPICSNIFQLTPTPSGPWTQNVLATVPGGARGRYPAPPLAFGKGDRILYGATNYGGLGNGLGYGVIFDVKK